MSICSKLVAFLFFSFSVPVVCAAPSVAFFYGSRPPWDELQAFDIVVVKPQQQPRIDALAHSSARSQLFAYVSLRDGEEDAVESLAGLWREGYRGFYLDGVTAGHADLVHAIHARLPEAKLILDGGNEILPQVHDDIYAVAAPPLFHRWDAASEQYTEVKAADRERAIGELKRVVAEYKLPVIVTEYLPTSDRAAARDTARKVAALGFIPWVTDGPADALGVGSVEVMPRKVLMLYEGDGSEFSLMEHRIHRLATMPLNYLGYTAEYLDVTRDALPDYPLAGRYAGIVTWLGHDQTGRKGVNEWFAKQRADGIKIAMLGVLPFEPESTVGRAFGLSGYEARQPARTVKVDVQNPLIGYEAQPALSRADFFPLHAADATTLLRVESDHGDTMDAAALTPWGGYVLAPYELLSLPGEAGDRWVVQPIEFFKRALALPSMPVPDVTTENGRRLMMVHVDGDGFVNRAERMGTPYSGEVLLDDVLSKYHIPQTVSVIEGEIAPNGLYPAQSPQLEKIARKIFALPNVEIASHTFSHPFRWDVNEKNADEEAYHLDIPGYHFSLRAEIDGSIDYINARLAPKGKHTQMIFWPGDANPGEAALARADAEGVLNLNGGDTTITRKDRTLTRVAPLGLEKGSHFQIYAPVDNENLYTNLWRGPFYGFERVIETFQLTDAPYRLKPIDIYYHFYSASKTASLHALEHVYDWALGQPVMNVYESDYARKVLDFNHFVVARGADGWVLRGNGALREMRMPAALGVPDVAASQDVAGYEDHDTDRYVHMADGDALLRVTATDNAGPRLVDANGRVDNWHRTASGVAFDLDAYVPLQFDLGNAGACRVQANGKPLAASSTSGAVAHYVLRTTHAKGIGIDCGSAA